MSGIGHFVLSRYVHFSCGSITADVQHCGPNRVVSTNNFEFCVLAQDILFIQVSCTHLGGTLNKLLIQ